MHALTAQSVQVGWQNRDKGLALTRPHLGNVAIVKHHAADELHVERPHADGALCRLSGCGEGFRQ